MDEAMLREQIVRFRFHLTESLSDSPEFKAGPGANIEAFYRALHREYKTALEVMIAAQMDIEDDVSSAQDETERRRKLHLKAIAELCFNTLVWICFGWERDHVKRLFKGPKHGSLKSRNAASVLGYVRDVNKEWQNFAVPLDFCRFESIADVLQMQIDPMVGSSHVLLIEAKGGRVNEAIRDTIAADSEDKYFQFFKKFGEPGIKQMERTLKQAKKLSQQLEIIRTPGSGHFEIDEGSLHVTLPNEPRQYYTDSVNELLKSLRSNPFGYFIVDGCLLVAGIRAESPDQMTIGDFYLRHAIHHTFSTECAMCAQKEDWMPLFANIQPFDGLAMFGSVALEGIAGRRIDTQGLLDLLFGKIRLFYHLDGDRLIDVCHALKVEAGYLTPKETRRFLSHSREGAVLFNSRVLWTRHKDDSFAANIMDGVLHDICLNWVHPSWWVGQSVGTITSDAG